MYNMAFITGTVARVSNYDMGGRKALGVTICTETEADGRTIPSFITVQITMPRMVERYGDLREGIRVSAEGRFESYKARDGHTRYHVAQLSSFQTVDSGDMNHVVLWGRIASDVRVNNTQGGNRVSSFVIANSRSYQKDGGWVEVTSFLPVSAWGNISDESARFSKGDAVWITGHLYSRSYENKNGEKVYTTEINADSVVYGGTGKRNITKEGASAYSRSNSNLSDGYIPSSSAEYAWMTSHSGNGKQRNDGIGSRIPMSSYEFAHMSENDTGSHPTARDEETENCATGRWPQMPVMDSGNDAYSFIPDYNSLPWDGDDVVMSDGDFHDIGKDDDFPWAESNGLPTGQDYIPETDEAHVEKQQDSESSLEQPDSCVDGDGVANSPTNETASTVNSTEQTEKKPSGGTKPSKRKTGSKKKNQQEKKNGLPQLPYAQDGEKQENIQENIRESTQDDRIIQFPESAEQPPKDMDKKTKKKSTTKKTTSEKKASVGKGRKKNNGVKREDISTETYSIDELGIMNPQGSEEIAVATGDGNSDTIHSQKDEDGNISAVQKAVGIFQMPSEYPSEDSGDTQTYDGMDDEYEIPFA